MKMNLSVVLGMIDKTTAPLKKVTGQYGYFTPKVKQAQKALKSTSSTMADISAYNKNLKALKANNDQINIAAEKLDKYQKIIKSGKSLTASQSAQFNKQKNKLTDLKQAQTAYKEALGKTGGALKKAGVDTKNLADEEKRLSDVYDTKAARLQTLQKRYKSLNGLMQVGKQRAKQAGIGAAAVGSGVLGASATVFSMVNSTAEDMDKLTKTAQNMKLPLETLQALQYQAQLNGVEADTMSASMIRFTRRFGVLQSTGSGELGSFLKKSKNRLFMDLKNAKNVEKGYNHLLQAFGKLKTEQEQMAFANAAFGDSGRRMLLMLRQDTEGLAGARKELNDLGGIVTNEETSTSEQFLDAMLRIEKSIGGMKVKVLTKIMAQLLPYFSELIQNLKDPIWRAEAIDQTIGAIHSLFNGTKFVFNLFKMLVDYFPEVFAGLLMVKTATFALNAAMMANPIGLVVAAISALVIGIGYAYSRSETFRKGVKGLWDMFVRAGTGITGIISKIISNFLSIPKAVLKVMTAIPEKLLPSGWHQSIKNLHKDVAGLQDTIRQSSDLSIDYALTGSETGILKSQNAQSNTTVDIRVKSDSPTEIEGIQTKGTSNVNVDTGSMLGFSF